MIKTAEELKQKPCKFQIGDSVTLKRPDLYGCTKGKVVEVERLYKRIEQFCDGWDFESGGLVSIERDISHICIPYDFDGETLTVHYPESQFGDWTQRAHSEKSKFFGWGVTVETKKMRTFVNEKFVKKEVGIVV